MRLRLLVPTDVDTPTGGNVYDLAAAAALRDEGDEVEVLRCEPSALSDTLRQPWSGYTLVDGLLACPNPHALAPGQVGVLVHMPLTWQTGLSPADAAILDLLERRALQTATVVISTSHWTAQYVTRHHGVHHVAVAQPGVDPAPVSPGSQPPLVVHLAAFLPNKAQLAVVAALERVRDLSWHARLAGSLDRDPVYAAMVKDAVEAAGLTDRLEMPGVMDRGAALAGANLALLPSRAEAFGMVVSEALARGIPVVVSEGGAAEALGTTASGERPGVVIPAGDTDALTRALDRWLTDQTYRSELRSHALSRRANLDGWGTTACRIRQALTRD